ncbi:MAG: Fic/DOC family N-terminal domain-containing protein [Candidatus Neptunochlamydia sp.]|nr:Fic/DOC family N-terminal domain-containing protein [Candidatus Neptunochlamydia sp.]
MDSCKELLTQGLCFLPLTNEEAVLLSKIERTEASVDEVLEQEARIFKEGEKGKDIQEIINYRAVLKKR